MERLACRMVKGRAIDGGYGGFDPGERFVNLRLILEEIALI
jgi:hypothetical protein